MNKFNKIMAALALSLAAPIASAAVSVTGTVTSDYVFRGVSQTDSSPALQVGLDYEHDNGFYAGIWGSNVDWGVEGDDTNLEIDYFVGYYGEASNFAYDITYNFYSYNSEFDGEDYDSDYGELIFNVYLDALTLTAAYADDYVAIGDSALYAGASYDIELPQEYALTLQAGYSFGDGFTDAMGEEVIDYSATVAKTFNGFDVTAAIVGTDMDGDNTDTRFVVGVSRTF